MYMYMYISYLYTYIKTELKIRRVTWYDPTVTQ